MWRFRCAGSLRSNSALMDRSRIALLNPPPRDFRRSAARCGIGVGRGRLTQWLPRIAPMGSSFRNEEHMHGNA